MKIGVNIKFERNLLESFYIVNTSQREETTGVSKCYVFQVQRIIISRGDMFFGWNLSHTVYKSLGIKFIDYNEQQLTSESFRDYIIILHRYELSVIYRNPPYRKARAP